MKFLEPGKLGRKNHKLLWLLGVHSMSSDPGCNNHVPIKQMMKESQLSGNAGTQ